MADEIYDDASECLSYDSVVLTFDRRRPDPDSSLEIHPHPSKIKKKWQGESQNSWEMRVILHFTIIICISFLCVRFF